jgi:hypothetical protein
MSKTHKKLKPERDRAESSAAQTGRDDDDLKLAVQIMSGLLASGHFTEIDDEHGDSQATRWWRDDEQHCHIYAVDETASLLRALKEKLRDEARLSRRSLAQS